MHRFLIGLMLVSSASAGCAPRPTPDPAPQPAERVLVIDTDGRVIRSSNTAGPAAAELPVPPATAFRALLAAYAELGIAPEVADQRTLRIARTNLPMRRTFAGERVRAYFDCGQSITGARADDGRLIVSVASQAGSGAAGSVIATTVTAVVRSDEGTSTSPTTCSSTGRLESRIHQTARRHATG